MDALLGVRDELLVSNSGKLPTWTGDNPCNAASPWEGVSCNGTVVVGLNLASKLLTGPLPVSLRYATGLRSLRLDSNSFTGGLLADWSTLSSLTELQLQANNAVYGALPAQWSTLVHLAGLNLGFMSLTGTIPAQWGSQLTALARLVLHSNTRVCGTLPGVLATVGRVVTTNTGLGAVCPPPPPAPPAPPPSQAGALLSLRYAMANWPAADNLYGWDYSVADACSWGGVVCSGTVATEVDLGFWGLQGTLPDELAYASGLTKLVLTGNA